MDYALCPSCSFPVLVKSAGQKVICPNCHQKGIILEEVSMRSKIAASPDLGKAGFFFLGLFIGVLFAPPIIASVKEGREYLAKLVERKLGK
jgi:predicted RNA-binding Zn-ribbon protein involved in translation (DUF1610 family)